MEGKGGIRNGRANTASSLARLLNRLPLGIERTHIDRTRSVSFRLLIRWGYRIAVGVLAGVWRGGLESADSEGCERKLSFGDLAVVVEIEPPIQ